MYYTHASEIKSNFEKRKKLRYIWALGGTHVSKCPLSARSRVSGDVFLILFSTFGKFQKIFSKVTFLQNSPAKVKCFIPKVNAMQLCKNLCWVDSLCWIGQLVTRNVCKASRQCSWGSERSGHCILTKSHLFVNLQANRGGEVNQDPNSICTRGWLRLMRDLEGRHMTVNEQIVSPLLGCCLAPSPRYVCSAKKMTNTKTKIKTKPKTKTKITAKIMKE